MMPSAPPRAGIALSLIGIGCGGSGQLTQDAIRAINAADLILIPRKGDEKSELADLRRSICKDVLTSGKTRIVEFDLPVRNAGEVDYRKGVDDWHDAVAAAWSSEIRKHHGNEGRVALLIWGDPSLYDSSLRIARRLNSVGKVEVVPGVTSIQALCAAHALPLNEIGEPFLVTTGRRLREDGWPAGTNTVVVMLDGGTAFSSLDPAGLHIWWGAYLGMAGEILIAGTLAEAGPRIAAARSEARTRHGWIMDSYILKRGS
jgi:precorrin-6A synthase